MNSLRVNAIVAVSALFALASMSPASGLGTGTQPTVGRHAGTPANVRTIRPSATDPGISAGPANHVVIPATRTNGKLFVFLPGSGAAPDGYDDIIETASSDGYHAIGLTYNNAAPASVKCGGRPACFGPLHQNVFDGTGSSTASDVSPKDGISHRLAALLRYLNAHYPTEGWGPYVHHGHPVWARVVISGHSQGAGEAAYIASIEKVAGVLLFSGVVDGHGNSPLATWLTEPHKTSAKRYTSLANVGDQWSSREQHSWTALGIPGSKHPHSIDTPIRVGAHSHAFLTSAKARIPGTFSAHDEPAADPYVPTCPDGTPRLAKTWTAMLALATGAKHATISTAC